ncbi:TPA: hypothetical protein RQJ82_004271 [Vibrio vulnificus]|nr:hypothetical protein [Vibrio parahaemolyticus]HDY7621977.1 hypothetical protein [Vibrio vulnificus]EHW0641839.1 hypothetical protein [Vibrio parahaemolyticus]EHZ2740805.1 hypothetical protein [Vibrio parahaemolyticus]ELB7608959.1 hypothetical protein [Vibrio parahaemolyticus]MBE4160296.1 hypothetical protein [Vibrio parahaemolyticus]
MVKLTGKILSTHGDWVVTTYGIECTSQPYPIAKSRYEEDDWIDHVGSKTWVIKSDFEAAFKKALELHR